LSAAAIAAPGGAVLGQLQTLDDMAVYPVVARVGRRTDAFVVYWRRVSGSG
jgi:hypothetical protein